MYGRERGNYIARTGHSRRGKRERKREGKNYNLTRYYNTKHTRLKLYNDE